MQKVIPFRVQMFNPRSLHQLPSYEPSPYHLPTKSPTSAKLETQRQLKIIYKSIVWVKSLSTHYVDQVGPRLKIGHSNS